MVPRESTIRAKARALLTMSKADRDTFFNGRKDENGKAINRGVIGIRGVEAAEEIKATMERLQEARSRKN